MDHFFKKDSVNSLISICFSDLKDQKLPISAIKTQIDNNRSKILLARRAHKWSRRLACSNYGSNRAIWMSANVKTRFLWNYFKIWPMVSENKIFLHYTDMNFFMSVKCKKPPFTRAMFMEGSKFLEQFLKRVTKGTFLWNYFKIWPAVSEKIFYEFLHVQIVQEAPIHQSHVYGQIKISRMKRVTQGTFLRNYFKIWPAVSEKIF